MYTVDRDLWSINYQSLRVKGFVSGHKFVY